MKSMRRTRRAFMLAMELTSDLTKFPMEPQYLGIDILSRMTILFIKMRQFKDDGAGVEFAGYYTMATQKVVMLYVARR